MIVLALVTVLLSPWKGPSLPTTPTGNYEASWAMTVRGVPHARVQLSADGVAPGWVASFCTPRLCAPFHTIAALDGKGIARYQFSLIRTDPKATAHTRASIRANNHAAATAAH
ncbi:MAG TPA: hypothetical protein VFW34_05065 [Candidatus Rubrimentiphilum sp.]|nr:hypothetical protein [Candidatus Rubrimentiphilum sp.]